MEDQSSKGLAWQQLSRLPNIAWKKRISFGKDFASQEGTFAAAWNSIPITPEVGDGDRANSNYTEIPTFIYAVGDESFVKQLIIGTPRDENDFGLESLNPLEGLESTLKKKGISATRITPQETEKDDNGEPVEIEDLASSYDVEFKIEKKGRKSAILKLFRSCGSGGCAQTFTLKFVFPVDHFIGPGIVFGKRDTAYLKIESVLKGSPAAERIGLKPGLIVREVYIDGKKTDLKGMKLEEAVNLIRGKSGTELVLSISQSDTGPTQGIPIPIP